MTENPFRLPRHTQPNHYDIRLELDLDTFTFTGVVGIDLTVVEPTDRIVLSAAEVEIKSAVLATGSPRMVKTCSSARVVLALPPQDADQPA